MKYIEKYKLIINQFIKIAKLFKSPIIICHKSTLYHRYSKSKVTSELLSRENDSIAEGPPRLIKDDEVKKLNPPLETVTYAEALKATREAMIATMIF